MVHGDLKCENVLIRKHDRAVKVVDFGFSRQFESKEEEVQILGQTTEYSPPLDEYLSFVYDSWSLGVILYVMMTHCLPFTAFQFLDGNIPNTVEIAKKVTEGYLLSMITFFFFF